MKFQYKMSFEDATNGLRSISTPNTDFVFHDRTIRASFSQDSYNDYSDFSFLEYDKTEQKELANPKDPVDKSKVKLEKFREKLQYEESIFDKERYELEDYIQKNKGKNIELACFCPNLPDYKYDQASSQILGFFSEDPVPIGKLVWLENSSSDYRGHYLYKAEDENVYMATKWLQKWTSVCYFTKKDMIKFFENNEDEIPDWEESVQVKEKVEKWMKICMTDSRK